MKGVEIWAVHFHGASGRLVETVAFKFDGQWYVPQSQAGVIRLGLLLVKEEQVEKLFRIPKYGKVKEVNQIQEAAKEAADKVRLALPKDLADEIQARIDAVKSEVISDITEDRGDVC